MARRGSKADDALRATLAELHALGADPGAPGAEARIAAALGARSSFVVAAAARLVGDHGLRGHEAALAAAFTRFADGGAAADPGCKAKAAVVEALVRLEVDEPELFRRGVRLRQLEPAFVAGGKVDTAVAVRVGSAAGLAQTGHPSAAAEAAELLADPEWDARAGAARALACCPRYAAEPALRLKLRTGDVEAGVLGECFRALLSVAPDALPLIAARLRDDSPEVAEQAALALGDSRLDDAFDALRAFVEDEPRRDRRRPALVAIGLLRRDAAVDYLLERVAGGDAATSEAAAAALAIYRDDARLAARLRAAHARRSPR
jgi:HEAT repeat protein